MCGPAQKTRSMSTGFEIAREGGVQLRGGFAQFQHVPEHGDPAPARLRSALLARTAIAARIEAGLAL